MRCWMASAKQMIEVLALVGYSTFELYMEDTYQIEGSPFWLLPWRLLSWGVAGNRSLRLAVWHDLVPCIQTCPPCRPSSNGALWVQELRWWRYPPHWRKKRFMTWLMACLPLCLNCRHARSISGWTKLTCWFGALPHFERCVDGSLLMCQHLERVLDIADKYGFHCQMWSDMFFKLMSADGQTTAMWKFLKLRVYLGRLKDRVTLVYWDYYQDSEKIQRNFRNHHKITRISPLQVELEVDWFHTQQPFQPSHCCRSQQSLSC